ncbi:MAG: four helix bundle protein [Atribacterota bacterium]
MNEKMDEEIKTHKDLRVWKQAMDMVEEIFKVTEQIPKSELYGLTSQIRRSAVSHQKTLSR